MPIHVSVNQLDIRFTQSRNRIISFWLVSSACHLLQYKESLCSLFKCLRTFQDVHLRTATKFLTVSGCYTLCTQNPVCWLSAKAVWGDVKSKHLRAHRLLPLKPSPTVENSDGTLNLNPRVSKFCSVHSSLHCVRTLYYILTQLDSKIKRIILFPHLRNFRQQHRLCPWKSYLDPNRCPQ